MLDMGMIPASDILNANILIVEDENSNILLLQRTLHNAGYTSITSTMDPHKVCELYQNHHFDLILLDIKMPVMDGLQVMESLKEIEAYDFPPILAITAEPGQTANALQAGAKDFVCKPIVAIEVSTRVHNLLEVRLLQKKTAYRKEDKPALSNVIQRNISKISQVRQKTSREQGLQDRISNGITSFSGSMVFLYLHIAWFSVWIFVNTGSFGIHAFDPFPFGLLAVIVSLEAIFLSTFVLISQNLLSKEAERIADLGLHIGLLTEHELTRVLQMLQAIQEKIGITNDADSKLADADLAVETNPEEVLAEIERLQASDKGAHHRAP